MERDGTPVMEAAELVDVDAIPSKECLELLTDEERKFVEKAFTPEHFLIAIKLFRPWRKKRLWRERMLPRLHLAGLFVSHVMVNETLWTQDAKGAPFRVISDEDMRSCLHVADRLMELEKATRRD